MVINSDFKYRLLKDRFLPFKLIDAHALTYQFHQSCLFKVDFKIKISR